jgi:CelD/BcsL family acetyltransferase involved in cellulose biosynthesis
MSTDLSVEVVRGLAGFIALKPEWDALHARAARATTFLSHKWLRLSWQQVWRGLPNRLCVVLVREDGQLVMAGAFALTVSYLLPTVRFLAFGPPQYEDVLYVASERTAEHARVLLDALRTLPLGPRWLRALRLQEDSPFRAAAIAAGLAIRTRSPIGSADLTLTSYADFDAYMQSMSKKTREGFRRQLRRLESLDGFEYRIETGEARFEALRWLFETKREWARTRKKPAPWLMNRSVDRFMDGLLRGDDAPDFWVQTFRAGDRYIAASLCLVERETLNYSKIAHDTAFDRYSPGFTLSQLMIRDAFAAGFERIDLGRGTMGTKLRLGKHAGDVLTVKMRLR